MVISHNLLAMNANRQYSAVSNNLRTSTEKLSSGYKINRAADDAAGLSISEKMRWQIRGLGKAENNIQDGISYVQVADGALSEVDNMLHRMNELAIQAANDTNTPEDRQALNEEITQIKTEITRIFDTTEFNTKKIWKGEVDPWIESPGFRDVPAVKFGSTSVSSSINNLNKKSVPKSGYQLQADVTGIKATWTGYNGQAYQSETIPWPDPLSGSHTFSLSNHMDYSTYPDAVGINMSYNYVVNENSTLADVIDAVNNSSVATYVTTRQVAQAYDYQGNPVYNGISFSPNLQYDKLLQAGEDMNNKDSAYIEGVKNSYGLYDNVVNPADTNPTDNFRFTFEMANIGTVTATVTSNYYYANVNDYNALSKDENIWWQWATRADGSKYKTQVYHNTTPNNASLNAIDNAAINSSTNTGLSRSQYGGYDVINFRLTSSSGQVGTMSMQINIAAGETLASIKSRLSQISGVDIYSNANNARITSYVISSNSSNTVREPYTEREHDPSKLIDIDLEIQSGATKDNDITISYGDMSLKYIGVHNIDVLNYKNASQAIEYIADALDIVSKERSNFGAYQNRLEHSKNVDGYIEDNTQSAESRIRDTDMASEIVNFSKENILAQMGQSMITQANSSVESVLSLLS